MAGVASQSGNYMASILVAGGIFIHDKIKGKKDAKRDAKRKMYEDRYDQLKADHEKTQPKQIITEESVSASARRTSEQSLRDEKHDANDGPQRWVDEARISSKR